MVSHHTTPLAAERMNGPEIFLLISFSHFTSEATEAKGASPSPGQQGAKAFWVWRPSRSLAAGPTLQDAYLTRLTGLVP